MQTICVLHIQQLYDKCNKCANKLRAHMYHKSVSLCVPQFVGCPPQGVTLLNLHNLRMLQGVSTPSFTQFDGGVLPIWFSHMFHICFTNCHMYLSHMCHMYFTYFCTCLKLVHILFTYVSQFCVLKNTYVVHVCVSHIRNTYRNYMFHINFKFHG
jgi:hypothetical protein